MAGSLDKVGLVEGPVIDIGDGSGRGREGPGTLEFGDVSRTSDFGCYRTGFATLEMCRSGLWRSSVDNSDTGWSIWGEVVAVRREAGNVLMLLPRPSWVPYGVRREAGTVLVLLPRPSWVPDDSAVGSVLCLP